MDAKESNFAPERWVRIAYPAPSAKKVRTQVPKMLSIVLVYMVDNLSKAHLLPNFHSRNKLSNCPWHSFSLGAVRCPAFFTGFPSPFHLQLFTGCQPTRLPPILRRELLSLMTHLPEHLVLIESWSAVNFTLTFRGQYVHTLFPCSLFLELS